MTKKIVFMGSPDFATPVLQSLIYSFHVIGVVTQPDRVSGRGRKITPPPVKTLAVESSIPILQPSRIREPETIAQLKAWDADLFVIAAFGQILPQNVLDIPTYGCINVHASLLPRWRGAAPIHAAIAHGDRKTGITIMIMDAGLDTGPILSQSSIPILADDTTLSLSARLAKLGADLLIESIPPYTDGIIYPKAQDNTNTTYAPMLKKSDGELDFNSSAALLERKIRAYHPWPGTFTYWRGKRLLIHSAHYVSTKCGAPGKKTIVNKLPGICTSEGLLVLDQVQPAGKKVMSGQDFLRGFKFWGEIE